VDRARREQLCSSLACLKDRDGCLPYRRSESCEETKGDISSSILLLHCSKPFFRHEGGTRGRVMGGSS
jgi:hypothetical protein